MTLLRLDDYLSSIIHWAMPPSKTLNIFSSGKAGWQPVRLPSQDWLKIVTQFPHLSTCVSHNTAQMKCMYVYEKNWDPAGRLTLARSTPRTSNLLQHCLNGATYINRTYTAGVRDTGALCGSIQEYWHGDHVLRRLHANKSEQWREITYIKN